MASGGREVEGKHGGGDVSGGQQLQPKGRHAHGDRHHGGRGKKGRSGRKKEAELKLSCVGSESESDDEQGIAP